jgi:hypothetical protein
LPLKVGNHVHNLPNGHALLISTSFFSGTISTQ